MERNLLEDAKKIISILRAAGFQGFLVGGCARDILLGIDPKDYDIATDARPEQVLGLFPGATVVGAHFGVVLYEGVEIATYRSDHSYSDGRRPDEVSYETSALADASRRDFTVNAMYLDPFTGKLWDFFGGTADLDGRQIRCVGDADQRFKEDHLRMLRAVRFAVRLGFDIEDETFGAMHEHHELICKVAVERVRDELLPALRYDPLRTVGLLEEAELFDAIFPEFWAGGVSLAVRCILEQLVDASSELVLASLLHELEIPMVNGICRRLKLPNEQTEHVLGILKLQERLRELSPQTWRVHAPVPMYALKRLVREPHFRDALTLFELMASGLQIPTCRYLKGLLGCMTEADLNPPRLVTGDDLITIGLKPGRKFKAILDAVENEQLNGETTTREQALHLIVVLSQTITGFPDPVSVNG